MTSFDEGYNFFVKQTGAQAATYHASQYVQNINHEINELYKHLNSFNNFKTDVNKLKGDVAEFWHSGTFNVNAAVNDVDSRTSVERSHDFASADINSNFGELFGLKYYKNGVASAQQQAKSIFERFNEYKAKGGSDSLESFLQERGFTDDTVLSDPIYAGQVRIIPKDQLETACEWLKQKIEKESITRPEQVERYKETLKMLSDRLRDGKGTESIPLSEAEAKTLAELAKKGDITYEQLKTMGISADELIKFEHIAKQAFSAGITAATISVVLKVAPEIYKAIDYLIKTGKLEAEQFRKIGFAALKGGSEGFVRGSVSAAITVACQSGMLGSVAKTISPSVVGMATVLTLNTMQNAFKVANGDMTSFELSQELIRELIVSSTSLAVGGITQTFIGIPVLGFMIGSFVGSVIGSFAYNSGYNAVISFCIDTGFTMFGLVKQNYTLPKDVLESIGINVFEYEKFEFKKVEIKKFSPLKFNYRKFRPKTIGVHILRRGVIGVNEIGYC